MADEENARFIGGLAPRACDVAHAHDDDRRVACARLRDVLGATRGDTGRLGRARRSVDAGRLARTRRLAGASRVTAGVAVTHRRRRPRRSTGRSITLAGSTSSTASIRRTRRRRLSLANSAPAIWRPGEAAASRLSRTRRSTSGDNPRRVACPPLGRCPTWLAWPEPGGENLTLAGAGLPAAMDT